MLLIQTLIIFLNILQVQLQQPFLNFGMIEVAKDFNYSVQYYGYCYLNICHVLQRPPHFMTKNNKSINNKDQTFRGSWVDAIEWLSRRLHFSSAQF